MMKYLVIAALLGVFFSTSTSCANNEKPENGSVAVSADSAKVVYLTKETFKAKVFDYEANKEWKYAGNVPAIVDFYADWCGPCRMLSPVLEDLQKQYGNKLQVYKINTDKEKELAATFGIRSLPTVVFIPLEGQPQAVMGFQPKESLEQIISNVLKVQK
ncbi:thioredoxin [Breznakibacter xylanolyticus]|nr:thioredoxin [Breznakibacter xylanolyticus]